MTWCDKCRRDTDTPELSQTRVKKFAVVETFGATPGVDQSTFVCVPCPENVFLEAGVTNFNLTVTAPVDTGTWVATIIAAT